MVRRTLSKADHEYYTFLTDLGAKRVLAYLNDRLTSGEVLSPDPQLSHPLQDTKGIGGRTSAEDS